MQILVDADSCPKLARDMLLRFSARLDIPIVFAANRPIPDIKNAKTASSNIHMEICSSEEGAADRRIIELAENGDLVVTRDLPLAEILVEKNIRVIDDRGRVFTRENIRELRSIRDFTVDLAESGLGMERIAAYGKKELNKLANSLDRELTLLRQTISG